MLKFDNVSFQYDVEDFSIIDHLSFDVQDGEFVSVIGASGCGKSTIFRLVNKLLLPASGEILVDGESIEKKRNYCGYMPQQDLLFPWRTVRENLLLPMEIRGGYSKTEMREKADAALESVGLKDWGDKMPTSDLLYSWPWSGRSDGCQRDSGKGTLSAYHRVPDDPDDSSGTAFCALVRIYDLEQGACDGADHIFPDHDHGIRRI